MVIKIQIIDITLKHLKYEEIIIQKGMFLLFQAL